MPLAARPDFRGPPGTPPGGSLDRLRADALDGFGTSIALHGDLLLTGSPEEDSRRGAVYVHSVSTGTQLARLTASDRAAGDAFGSAVAISPHYLLIGAPLDTTNRGTNAGSGYLFENLTPFKQVSKLTDEGISPDHPTNANARLGSSVALALRRQGRHTRILGLLRRNPCRLLFPRPLLGLGDALTYLVPDLPQSEYVRLAERYRTHYFAGDAQIPLFEGAKAALHDLQSLCAFYRVLGTYPLSD
jgi:hypothetical protein